MSCVRASTSGERRGVRKCVRGLYRAIPERLVVPYYSAAETAPAAKWTTTAVMLSVDPRA